MIRTMFVPGNATYNRGFTLLELLVVMAIIGILATVVLTTVDVARSKGRDAARKTESLEILKALELYYSDNGLYPDSGTVVVELGNIETELVGGGHLPRIPLDTYYGDPASDGYQYCALANQIAFVLGVNVESDDDVEQWCSIVRGDIGAGNTCANWITASAPSCAGVF